MKNRRILSFAILLFMAVVLHAQTGVTIRLNSITDGSTVTLDDQHTYGVTDDGAVGIEQRYSLSTDYSVTLTTTMCSSPYRLALFLDELDIDPHDTLYIYDGPGTSSPVLFKINNALNAQLLYHAIYVSPTNASQTLTIRFRASGASDGTHLGFTFRAQCAIPCEVVTAVIDTFYYRTVDGQVVQTSTYVDAETYDTTFHPITGQIVQIDTQHYRGLNLCQGQGVILCGHGEYTRHTGYYTPSDATSTFTWTLGNGDSIVSVGGTQVLYDGYVDFDCYDVNLYIEDAAGCRSGNHETVQVRIAQNPIKTILPFSAICQSDSILVDVGYEGANARLILQHITFRRVESKINDVKTFIPDGLNCSQPCYEAPVFFTEFPVGRTIQSAEDVCSICINYEHSFMGDYRLSIICPTGATAVLKFAASGYDPGIPSGAPEGSYGGSGTYTGYPYGAPNDGTWDGSSGQYCDSIYNMYGVGLDYCFSRNGDYLLVDGRSADQPVFNAASGTYLGSSGYTISVQNYQFETIPPPYSRQGQSATGTFTTKQPSDYENKTNYYTPYSDFSELIGCPLNGEWNIQVCDYWRVDNGWVFSWSMDICDVSAGNGCEYQVGIDSVTWEPDPAHSSIDATGRYRGLVVSEIDSVKSFVHCQDTAGIFPILLHVYDEFGCQWDTSANLPVAWNPSPDLGDDTVLCDVESIILDASDRHTGTENYTYIWEPTGDTTSTLRTLTGTGTDVTYSVEVTNHYSTHLSCYARDTIVVKLHVTPVPNIDPGVYPLEGCEPYTVSFTNNSLYGEYYLWDFGDSTTSTDKHVSHTYPAGVYDIKYYVYTDGGCIDSLIYPSMVRVFHSPVADFTWDPVYPTVLSPVIHLQNRTEPAISGNNYFWEIQYDRDNPYSFHTLRDEHPTFRWESDLHDVSGSYAIRLIARTDNYTSGGVMLQCADTAETAVLVVNDFLQFPNVVTPNGDGINDRFVIGNLVTGFSYPVNRLDIYNRWGVRVYHMENIASEDDFWDPSNEPAGTYYYRFSARGFTGDIDHNGTVEVIK
ncbi:MAG: PKD domain-containing protein [bacterium P3]|nr:MAG: PKD domain-containing protein [bacterium P3]KWW38559.1 MAG: PKD domain-containing protein [bacterium F083]